MRARAVSSPAVAPVRDKVVEPWAATQLQPVYLLAACAIVQFLLLTVLGPAAKNAFRLQFTISDTKARAILAEMSEDDQRRFQQHFLLDCFYPPLYALLLRRRARAILPRAYTGFQHARPPASTALPLQTTQRAAVQFHLRR